MIKKIILAILPMYFWLILIVGILLYLFTTPKDLSMIMFNLFFSLFFIRVGVVIHEIGHLVFAKIIGGIPKRMILGKGHEVVRFDAFNIKIILNKSFNGGLAFANFNEETNTKFKKILFISGGFLTNLIVAYLCYLLFGYETNYSSGKIGISLNSAFIFINIALAVFSLIPFYGSYQGLKIPTDGLRLLRLPFRKYDEKNSEIDLNEFFEAFEFFEVKNYVKAIEIYEKFENHEETKLNSRINLSIMYSKIGDFTKAYDKMESCISLVEEKKLKFHKALVYNGLAWFSLLKNDLTDIDYNSKVAYSISPINPSFLGTRGSVLIELGKTKQGLEMLKPLVNFGFPNNETLSASIYLYFGYSKLNEGKKAKKYYKFIIDNFDKLDLDERVLWENITKRVKEPNSFL